MCFINDMDWTRTESGLHSIIPEHIRTCTHVSQATRAEYRQKYFTTLALCLQIIPVRRPLVSGGEGPEQWYNFKSLSWPNPGLPGKKPQSPGISVKIWFLHFFGLSGMLPMLCALWQRSIREQRSCYVFCSRVPITSSHFWQSFLGFASVSVNDQ